MSCQTILYRVVILMAALMQAGVVAGGSLNKKHVSIVNGRVLPAFRQGNPLAILHSLSPLVNRLDSSEIVELDTLLAERNLPPTLQLLADARLAMLHQNLAHKLPVPQPREIVLILPVLKERIDQVVAGKKDHPAFLDPLPEPKSMDEYKTLFWKIHVFDNRLQTAIYLARYAGKLSESVSQRKRRTLDQQQRQVLEADYEKIAQAAGRLRQELEEREIELRLQRLALAGMLVQQSDDFKERLLAAYVADLDGAILADFFRRAEKHQNVLFVRTRLNEEGLSASIDDQVNRLRNMAGDLVVKGRLLFTGLHWWTRGRYGRGPDGGGLLKSALALRSPQAQLGLYMPILTPKPTDPMDPGRYPVPQVDRRHHYIWAMEYRRIQDLEKRTTKTETSAEFSGQVTTLSHFY